MTRAGVFAAVAALLVAVGVGVIASGNDRTDPVVEESNGPDPVQDCGTYEASYERPEDEGYRCAAAAFAAGRPARLEVTRPTDEDDPVVLTYETDGLVVRVTQDHRRDRLSDGGIGRKVCREWTIDPAAGDVEPQDCSVEQPR